MFEKCFKKNVLQFVENFQNDFSKKTACFNTNFHHFEFRDEA